MTIHGRAKRENMTTPAKSMDTEEPQEEAMSLLDESAVTYMLVLTKGAQPLSTLGSALAAIARQPAPTGAE